MIKSRSNALFAPGRFLSVLTGGVRVSSYERPGLWCAISTQCDYPWCRNSAAFDDKWWVRTAVYDNLCNRYYATPGYQWNRNSAPSASDQERTEFIQHEIMENEIRGSRISKACDQRSCRITAACDQRSCRISAAWVQGVFQNFCSMKSRGLAEFLQHDIEGSCRISAARHRGFLQNFCSVISRGQQNFCSMTPRIKGSCRISATWDQGGRRISPAWDQGVLQNLLSPLRRFCW